MILGLVAGMVSAASAADVPMRLVSITAPVRPGGNVLLVVQTQSGATCGGERQDNGGGAYTVKLRSQSAANDGLVWWFWTTRGGAAAVGVRGIRVTCVAGDHRGVLDATFDVE